MLAMVNTTVNMETQCAENIDLSSSVVHPFRNPSSNPKNPSNDSNTHLMLNFSLDKSHDQNE